MPSSYNALIDTVCHKLTDTLVATYYRSPVATIQQWKLLRRGGSTVSGRQNLMNHWQIQRPDATYG